jgi:hypothetical protein
MRTASDFVENMPISAVMAFKSAATRSRVRRSFSSSFVRALRTKHQTAWTYSVKWHTTCINILGQQLRATVNHTCNFIQAVSHGAHREQDVTADNMITAQLKP